MRNAHLYSDPGIPPTFIPRSPVIKLRGRKIAATIDNTYKVRFVNVKKYPVVEQYSDEGVCFVVLIETSWNGVHDFLLKALSLRVQLPDHRFR